MEVCGCNTGCLLKTGNLNLKKHYCAAFKSSPYEETVDGAHNGKRILIRLSNDLILIVQEVKSGIGDYFEVQATWRHKFSKVIGFGVHDDADVDGMFP